MTCKRSHRTRGLQRRLGLCVSLSLLPIGTVAQFSKWCGKYYQVGAPNVPPTGQFNKPVLSETALLNFQCWPAYTPYISPEDTVGAFILDTPITHDVGVPFDSSATTYSVSIHDANSGALLASAAELPINTTGSTVPFNLSAAWPASKSPNHVTCTLTLDGDGRVFSANTVVKYLPPNPYGGSTTKLDHVTGALVVKDKDTGTWGPIFAFGFYTSFDNYLVPNYTAILQEMKAWGYNLVHPVPTFGNLTAFNSVVDYMEEIGLWLMYDYRWTYMNLTSVAEQVGTIRGRSNLLLHYTADEPDGQGDPLNATSLAKDLLYDLDGYHPVSLCLNCQDYHWTEYSNGADIVMEDVYPVDLHYWNYSIVYNTTCNATFGCCGCDNCTPGGFRNIQTRLEEYAERRRWTGKTRWQALWGVPQAFGASQWWPREPTGAEWLMMTTLSVNHGAMGIVPWDMNVGTTDDVKAASAKFGGSLKTLTPFLTSHSTTKTSPTANTSDVSIAAWTLPGPPSRTLVLIANVEYAEYAFQAALATAAGSGSHRVENVYRDGGATRLTFENGVLLGAIGSVGSGAWVISHEVVGSHPRHPVKSLKMQGIKHTDF